MRVPTTTLLAVALLAAAAFFGAVHPAAADQTCGNSIIEAPETCDDGNTTPGDGCSAFCLVEEENCLNDFAMFNNPTCTANDVTIALVLNVSQAACELGKLIDLDLLAKLEAGSDERYDIATWIGQDAGDAKFGTCDHQVLHPATDSFSQVCSINRNSCSSDSDCTIAGEQCLDTDYFPGGPSPPYSCADPFDAGEDGFFCAGTLFHDGDEGSEPTDLCGDIQQDVDTFYALGTLTVPCVDVDMDGHIDIPTCVSWENNANAAACLTVDDAIPGTPSKCRCELQNVGNVFIAGKIVVIKQTLPDGDPEEFTITLEENTSPDPTTLETFLLQDGEMGMKGGLFPTEITGTTYSVAETVPDGWELTDVSCESDMGNTVSDETAIDLMSGETVTCTFTNTKDGKIIVEKQTLPDGDPATFDFSGDVAGTLGDGGTIEVDVEPGSYSSTETVPSGWNLTSIVCDDSDSTGDTGTATASFEVDPGETVTCVFTNTKNGMIVVEKQTIPDGDPATFDFSGDVAGTIGDGGTLTEEVEPGSYSSTETVPSGWDLTSIVCDDGDSTGDTGTATASFEVAAGETVTCVFTNTKRGHIIVEKQTLPDGDPATFDFSGDAAGTIGDGGTIDEEVEPGSYSSTETVPAGWDLTSIVCDDGDSTGDTGTATASFEVAAGETVTCVFTNTKRGHIIVEKQTLPDGDPATFDFSGDAAGTIGDGGTIDEEVEPGSYSSTETVPAGWDLTSIVCDDGDSTGDTGTATASFEVDPGETVTCVFTNTKRGHIIVEKQTVPDGDPATFDFSGDAAGTIGDGGTIDEEVEPGSYSSTETVPAGWDLTSIVCDDGDSTGDTGTATASFEVDPGETVTCVFTNTKRGHIIVEKQTVPDGDPATFDFSGDAAGTLGDGGTIDQEVQPGTYSSTESVPAGWDLTSVVCNDGNSTGNVGTATATFNVEAGETVTCTFTNTKRAHIIVEKQTLPDGDPATFDFSGDVAGTIGDGGTLDQEVQPGTYSSTETVPAGWDLTSIVCDDGDSSGDVGTATATFHAAAGETVTCTFTNTKRGKIIAVKQTLPDGDPTLFDFSGNLAGSIGDGQMLMAEVVPGTYGTEETVPAAWDLISIACDDGDSGGAGTVATYHVAPGEVVTCTFTNRLRGMVMVNKTESGTLPLNQPFDFEIREGASTSSEGTVLATGSADLTTGEVVFACAGVPDADCRNVDGMAKFPPGDYQLCETHMMPGWMNSLDGFTPLGATPEGGDNSTECVNFTLGAGDSLTFDVDNTPPPGGDARTIGFWKNWTSCDGHGNQDPVLDETLGDGIFLWGMDPDGLLVDVCAEAVDLLDKRMIAEEDVVGDGQKKASDAAYGMAAQLLAALLNIEATAGTCADLFAAVGDAQALLGRIGFDGQLSYLPPNPNQSDLLGEPDPAGGFFTRAKLRDLREQAEELAGTLDDYNNNLLCP